MNDLFDPAVLEETIHRIESLQPDAERRWGKMNPAQMLAHCSAALEVAIGLKHPPRIFIGRIIGPLFKDSFFGDAPMKKNSPTDKSFIIADERDFFKEQDCLITLVSRFSTGGDEACTSHPHSFFGRLAPREWSRGMYKHLDHHLKQFGA